MSDTQPQNDGRRRAGRWGAVGAGCLLAAALVWMVASGASWRREWVVPAVTSRGFIIHAAIVVFGAGVLMVLLCWLAKAVAARGKRLEVDGESGVAILEFVMVLPIALFLVLLMAQSALLLVGHMTVHYASYCAARSAIVYAPLDLTDESDEPHNVVDTDDYHDYTIKHEAIRRAAIWAVLPVSSSSRRLAAGDSATLEEGLREMFAAYDQDVPEWMLRLLERKLTYAEDYTKAWLSSPADGSDTYAEDEVLAVHVTHTFYLSIPYAGRLYAAVDQLNGTELDFGAGEYGMEITATCRLTNEGVRDVIELEDFPYYKGEFEQFPWYTWWAWIF